MTRADFYDWLIANKCTIEPLPENTTGNVIKIKSPISNSYVYYNTPIDERPVKCFSVCNICNQLYIPIPEACKEQQDFTDFIKKKYYPDRK